MEGLEYCWLGKLVKLPSVTGTDLSLVVLTGEDVVPGTGFSPAMVSLCETTLESI